MDSKENFFNQACKYGIEFFPPPSALAILKLMMLSSGLDPNFVKFNQKVWNCFQFYNISEIVVATENSRKCSAVSDFFRQFWLLRGTNNIPVRSGSTGSEEPDYANASAVASHKVRSLVNRLRAAKLEGGTRLVIGSDVVVRIVANDFEQLETVLFNLSRMEKLTGDHLNRQKARLEKIYANPFGSTITYNVAAAYSMKPNQ